MKLKFLIVPFLSLGATHAQADWVCTFTSECMNEDACLDTQYEMSVTISDDYTTGELISDAQTIPVTVTNAQATSYFTGYQSDSYHLLTIFKSFASYTTHMAWIEDDVFTITYNGTCSGT